MTVRDRPVRAAATRQAQSRSTAERDDQKPVDVAPGSAGDILRLQRIIGNQAVSRLIQRHCYLQYASLDEARNANPYAKAHLTKQKDNLISDHERQPFDQTERTYIYATNKARHRQHKITSDNDPTHVLTKSKLSVTPHVDHRFPKSKGGTNSFSNAQVISAKENMTKSSNQGTLAGTPQQALMHYAHLKDRNYTIERGRHFDAQQREEIYEANEAMYGRLRSDTTGVTLQHIDSSEVPHIDHITPKSAGGCSYYFNAKVLPADENIQKGGVRKVFGKGSDEDDDDDYETSNMTLAKYYAQKRTGKKKYLGKSRYHPYGGGGGGGGKPTYKRRY